MKASSTILWLRAAVFAIGTGATACAMAAATLLADAPVIVSSQVPPNIMMTLSVEWPTGTVAAYNDNQSTVAGFTCGGRDANYGVCYFPTRSYLGYFDPAKCYDYDTTKQYFVPKAAAAANANCQAAAGRWSGNFLNWASMHALDEFRYAMTGGDRFVDTTSETVIEKSRHTGQGGYDQFPRKRVRNTAYTLNSVTVPATEPKTVSPETWAAIYTRVSDDTSPLWEGSPRAGKVIQVSNNAAFSNAFGNARYVKVQLLGTNYLALAEVQVRDALGANIAQGKTATQSSTLSPGTATAARAVDGNTNGVYASNSVAHTNSTLQPWWQVDLGSSIALSEINIFGRSDCCQDRLQNFYVFASDNDMSGKTLQQLLDDTTVWKYRQIPQVTDASDGVVDNDLELRIRPAATDIARDAMNVRVRVCDASIGIEGNCKTYGSAVKPTGVVQDNADKMRFGVMSYLNVDGTQTMGGVLRSPLKYVGASTITPGGTPQANPRKEIDDATGTVYADPEGAVVAGGEFASSGVINYINKFGKTGTKSTLKGQDPASEMFYEGLRYLRGFTAATPEFISYSGANTVAARDGFPIYSDWTFPSLGNVAAIDKRPIQYSCQKSYFVGLGDTNTWCDTFGPGNTLVGCTGHGGGPSDAGIDVTALGNTIGAKEGLGALGNAIIAASRGDSYDIASYAYWANTHDIVPDDVDKSWTRGVQTAQTYWVDVRETGSFNGVVVPKNQYWLAGKYGGFDSAGASLSTPPTGFDPLNVNYFTGERPDKLISALRSVFKGILAKQTSSAPPALASTNLYSGGATYKVQYDSAAWTGDVTAYSLVYGADGQLNSASLWTSSAATQLDALNWDTGRKIVSFNPDAGSRRGVPFRTAVTPDATTLSAAQLAAFGSTATERNDAINYLRGQRTYESGTTAKYRLRTHVLGDIVDAQPVVVGAPADRFSDEFNPGYGTFATAQANRNKVIYVGANDGMLHAFDASTTAGGGGELFAYVPSGVITGPSSPATPSVDGIAGRTSINYDHRFLVDEGPRVQNIDFNNTRGASGAPSWRTLLVGGLGKGGKSFYALDVTSPPTSSTLEATVASTVLWEFTDEDMGYSFGRPAIVKTKAYGWVVIVSAGYDNLTSSVAANRGQGFLYVLNARTGALLKKISTGVGSQTTPSGLSEIIAFTPDSSDFTADTVYAGDLLGNLWRFDLTDAGGAYPAPTKLASLVNAAGDAQPVTTPPRVAVPPGSLTRWVFVGTGRLLDPSDRSDQHRQSFYAFKDGIQNRFNVSATLPSGVSFPIARSNLAPVSYTTLLSGLTPAELGDTAHPMGWFVDLSGQSVDGSTERVVDPVTVNSNLVAFVGKIPDADPCTPGVVSRVYVIDYTKGDSVLKTNDAAVAFYEESSSVLSIDLVINNQGVAGGIKNTSATSPTCPTGFCGIDFSSASRAATQLNWRELMP